MVVVAKFLSANPVAGSHFINWYPARGVAVMVGDDPWTKEPFPSKLPPPLVLRTTSWCTSWKIALMVIAFVIVMVVVSSVGSATSPTPPFPSSHLRNSLVASADAFTVSLSLIHI